MKLNLVRKVLSNSKEEPLEVPSESHNDDGSVKKEARGSRGKGYKAKLGSLKRLSESKSPVRQVKRRTLAVFDL